MGKKRQGRKAAKKAVCRSRYRCVQLRDESVGELWETQQESHQELSHAEIRKLSTYCHSIVSTGDVFTFIRKVQN